MPHGGFYQSRQQMVWHFFPLSLHLDYCQQLISALHSLRFFFRSTTTRPQDFILHQNALLSHLDYHVISNHICNARASLWFEADLRIMPHL